MAMPTNVRNWKTDDGLKIHCRIWENDAAEKEIWIVHGTGDHGGRYENMADTLVKAGFRVIAADHRGNGLSEGKRGHVASFDNYLDDLALTIKQTESGRRRYIVGQSMGSLITARYLMTRSQEFERAVLLSPMFRTTNPPPRFKLFLARMLRRFYPGLTLRAGFKAKDLTSSEERKSEYRQDELKHDFVSAELGLSMFEQGVAAMQAAETIRIPLLVMHGEIDKITCPDASREFAQDNELITLKIWNDMRHELYNESRREEVIKFLIDWLKE